MPISRPGAAVLASALFLSLALVPLPCSGQAAAHSSSQPLSNSDPQSAAQPLSQPSAPSSAPHIDLSGLVAGSVLARVDATFEPLFALRFIPELKFSLAVGRGVTLDAEASANVYGSVLFVAADPAETSGDIKPYRGWVRLSTSRFEARLGLQKLSFGSAMLFRPLMWFDSLDPRDPLQLTDGVYSLLLRYYTKGNTNVWGWGLLGNSDRRGFDLAPPDKKTPEFGGRVQVPLFKGELGATYHHRKAAIDGLVPILDPQAPLPVPPVPEDRFGLDGKWDLGVGVWLEAALVHQETPLLLLPFQRALTLGLDYTFALGRGLTVMAEQFRLDFAARAFARGDNLIGGRSLSALLLRYPLGLLDDLSGIFYYDWTDRNFYRFLSWKHTTNALSLNAILFWNPADLPLFPGQPGSSSFAGVGFELLLAYNF
jgi:hypothetical protein